MNVNTSKRELVDAAGLPLNVEDRELIDVLACQAMELADDAEQHRTALARQLRHCTDPAMAVALRRQIRAAEGLRDQLGALHVELTLIGERADATREAVA